MFKEVADIKTADMLDLPRPEAHFHTVVVKPTELQQDMVQELSERAKDVHDRKVDPAKDNMLKITSDGRKIGLDQRLMNPMLPDDPGSKVNACMENIHAIWERTGDEKLTNSIVKNIINKEVHAFHIEKAFLLANDRLQWKLYNYEIKEKVVYAPKTVRKGKFSYSFDAVARNGEKAVFIKVFKDATNTFRPAELLKLRKAVELVNKYYNSHVLVFSKRRFCDEATNEAAWDDSLSLVEIERLKF